MKIGLYNLEPHIINTAMMQVSSFHKDKGDHVEIYNPLLFHIYDKIYAFSLFNFTDKGYVRENMIIGGTGFDITTRLNDEIEKYDYDWTLYPNCDFSIIWFSRGCIRSCPFCVVRKKEGYIKAVEPKNLNPNGKYIMINDNNFFANPKWREAIIKIKEWNKPIKFTCGIDVRIFDDEQGKALQSIKLTRYIYIAWDNPKEDLREKIKLFIKYIRPYKIVCYVLIGYSSTEKEDLYRIEELRKMNIDPYVMAYDKSIRYQQALSRWCNHKAIFRKIKWEEYKYK